MFLTTDKNEATLSSSVVKHPTWGRCYEHSFFDFGQFWAKDLAFFRKKQQ
jgi:hypothetical protein